MTRTYRWLGDPRERQHVFIEDAERSLCHMVARGPHYGPNPDQFKCHWCKARLRTLKQRDQDLREIP